VERRLRAGLSHAKREGRRLAVDGSELVFILMPIVIPLFLAIGIAAPYIADSRANKRRRVYKKGKMTP
jgi:hypothetical protein